MASVHKEIMIEASPEHVWDAVRDVGAVHQRLTPGILADARLGCRSLPKARKTVGLCGSPTFCHTSRL